MNRQVLRIEPNQPVTVALEFPDGVNVQGFAGPQVKFSLTEQRVLYADPELARAIRTLAVQPGEPFTVTKRRETGRKPWWDLERVKGGDASGLPTERFDSGSSVTGAARDSQPLEAIRAANPPDSSKEPLQPQPTPVSVSKPAILPGDLKRIPPQITRTAPPPVSGIHLSKTPPLKPSYEDAFRECLRIVRDGLADAGENWSDHSVQAMTSTLFIQAARDGRLGIFQPQASVKVA